MKKLEEKIATLSQKDQKRLTEVIERCRKRQEEISKNREEIEESIGRIKTKKQEFNKSIQRFATAFEELTQRKAESNDVKNFVFPDHENSIKFH